MAVDIVPALGYKKNPPKERDDENSYFLSRHLNKNKLEFLKKFINPLLIKVCANTGFNAVCHYLLYKSSTIPKIRVTCHRSRKHDGSLNKKTNAKARYIRKTTVKKGKGMGPHAKRTRRPVRPTQPPITADDSFMETEDPFMDEERNQEKGPSDSEFEPDNPDHVLDNTIISLFALSAYFDEDIERWFPPKQGNDNAQHRGHPHIEPHLIRLRTDVVLDEAQRQLTTDARSSHISSAAARNLLFERTGHNLEWRQVHHLYQKDKAELLITQGLTDPSRKILYRATKAARFFFASREV